MEPTKKTYFGYLDSLRCLAFLAVFYAHTGTIFLGSVLTDAFPMNIWKNFFAYGSFGVNFFFVLSGFLITYLLLKEKVKIGTIGIKAFYIKRVLRIWPVYFMTLLFSALVLPIIIPRETYEVMGFTDPRISTPTFFSFFFFLGNFYQGLGLGMGALSMGILWSVCVEEQFYLVWPWFVRWFNARRLAFITILLICLSLLYKLVFEEDRLANYYFPWSVGMDLAFGALLGIAFFAKRQRAMIIGILITLMGSIAIIAATGFSLEALRLWKTPVLDCIFVLILLFFVNKIYNPRQKLLTLLTYLGKISYGLYAYHTICLMIVMHIFFSAGLISKEVGILTYVALSISAFILTVFAAHFSYKLVETYFLSLKNRFDR